MHRSPDTRPKLRVYQRLTGPLPGSVHSPAPESPSGIESQSATANRSHFWRIPRRSRGALGQPVPARSLWLCPGSGSPRCWKPNRSASRCNLRPGVRWCRLSRHCQGVSCRNHLQRRMLRSRIVSQYDHGCKTSHQYSAWCELALCDGSFGRSRFAKQTSRTALIVFEIPAQVIRWLGTRRSADARSSIGAAKCVKHTWEIVKAVNKRLPAARHRLNVVPTPPNKSIAWVAIPL